MSNVPLAGVPVPAREVTSCLETIRCSPLTKTALPVAPPAVVNLFTVELAWNSSCPSAAPSSTLIKLL